MNPKGSIYLKDIDGNPVGIGQEFEIRPVSGGFAAFLVTDENFIQLTATCDTIPACRATLGGLEIIVVDDF